MTSWYTHLNRDIPYLRSYRTHNLWLDQYHKKIRAPRVQAFHIGILKRLGKTYSGVSMLFLLTIEATYCRQHLWVLVNLCDNGSNWFCKAKGRG